MLQTDKTYGIKSTAYSYDGIVCPKSIVSSKKTKHFLWKCFVFYLCRLPTKTKYMNGY